MAYNNLSGTVMQPNALMPRHDRNGQIIIPIVSGNLSTSDGAEILNIPRLSNATDNALVVNVGGDANTLTCESNLTFDGSQLNITGDLRAIWRRCSGERGNTSICFFCILKLGRSNREFGIWHSR